MSISLRCITCKRDLRLNTKVCKCGIKLTKEKRKYKVLVKTPYGKWLTKIVGDLKTAKKIEAKFRTQVIEQKVFDIGPIPILKYAWTKYLAWAQTAKRSWDKDQQRYESHIAPYLANRRMDRIKPQDVQGILDVMRESTSRRGKPYQPATIKQVLVLLKRIYNWSIKNRLYHGLNPCVNVEIPKFDNRVTNTLNKDSLKQLIDVIDHWHNKRTTLVIKFSLYTGKRRKEVLSLKWNNVDFENGLVTFISQNVKCIESQTIPLNDSSLRVLDEARKTLAKSDYVFPDQYGQYAYYGNLDDEWKRIKKRAGVEQEFRLHDLRHTFASYLASSGKVDIYTLKELLGHKTTKMTERYAHLINGALRRGAMVADEVFN